MKHNQMLTDIKLEICNEVFYAHKVILAGASPYFKGKLVYSFFIMNNNIFFFVLKQCSPVDSGRGMHLLSSCKGFAPL